MGLATQLFLLVCVLASKGDAIFSPDCKSNIEWERLEGKSWNLIMTTRYKKSFPCEKWYLRNATNVGIEIDFETACPAKTGSLTLSALSPRNYFAQSTNTDNNRYKSELDISGFEMGTAESYSLSMGPICILTEYSDHIVVTGVIDGEPNISIFSQTDDPEPFSINLIWNALVEHHIIPVNGMHLSSCQRAKFMNQG